MSDPLILEKSVLGKQIQYPNHYDPTQLFPIARKTKRNAIGIKDTLPFFGFDIWNHCEVSWLNPKGKPIVALAKIIYDCDSEFIIESKSLKLYFNSLNNSIFPNTETLQATVTKDLTDRLKGSFTQVEIIPVASFSAQTISRGLNGICLDDLDIECSIYNTHPDYLVTENALIAETVYSDLLKSNCLVTNQPDWNSVQISYTGNKINHSGLLRYLVSFRNENEFHEQCIEKIFMHIMERCQPQELTVYGRSTRRGGLDINSYRSTKSINPNLISNIRLCRQ